MIGIDFGTTTSSSMAWVDPRSGEARILKNAEGEEKTPSVVYFGAGEPVVGSPAELMLEDDEERRRVVTSIKRELVNAPTLALPGRRVKAVEVAAAVFAKLKRDAEALYFQQPVTRAVVTCPAAFDVLERDAIAAAVRLGGFAEVEPAPRRGDRLSGVPPTAGLSTERFRNKWCNLRRPCARGRRPGLPGRDAGADRRLLAHPADPAPAFRDAAGGTAQVR